MIGDNRLLHAALDYAERSERLKNSYRKKDQSDLQRKIDSYEAGFLHRIPFIGYFLEPQEIRIMRSVLQEKYER